MDSVFHFPALVGASDGIASFMGSLKYSESLTAVLKHLGHEGQSVESPFRIKRLQNFFFAPDLNPFPGMQWFIVHFSRELLLWTCTAQLGAEVVEKLAGLSIRGSPAWRDSGDLRREKGQMLSSCNSPR
jgi:hypothetical protein